MAAGDELKNRLAREAEQNRVAEFVEGWVAATKMTPRKKVNSDSWDAGFKAMRESLNTELIRHLDEVAPSIDWPSNTEILNILMRC